MKKFIEFSNLSEFEKFERENKEKGNLFKHIEYYIPIDIIGNDFLAMEWIVLSFGDFKRQPVCLKISSETNELFIGNINLGGHGPRCRLLKIPREDIYLNSSTLIEWVENNCCKLWSSGIFVDERQPNLESLLEEDSPSGDKLAAFQAPQAIIRDDKPIIEEQPKEHWIIKLNFVLRFIRVLISPFR